MNIRDKIKERLGEKILEWSDNSKKRVYFTVDKKDILGVTQFLFRELGLRFAIASGVDTPSGFQILYHYSFDKRGEFYSLRVLLEDKKDPRIDSITPIFPGAGWIEREIWEMLGIKFIGHPNLKRLLLDDDWPEGKFPLRRDYEP